MSLHMIVSVPDQKFIFQPGVGGHLVFGPLAINAGIFERDMEAKYLLKGPQKSNPASNLTSQRMVTKLVFMT